MRKGPPPPAPRIHPRLPSCRVCPLPPGLRPAGLPGAPPQVQQKCQDVYNMLCGLQAEWRTYAMLTLAAKVLKQHELVQVGLVG